MPQVLKVDKLHFNKLVNVSASLNNFKAKVDNLDVGKNCSCRFSRSHVVSKEVVKKTVYIRK